MNYVRCGSDVKVGDTLFNSDESPLRVVSVDPNRIVTRDIETDVCEEYTIRIKFYGFFMKKHAKKDVKKNGLFSKKTEHTVEHTVEHVEKYCAICMETRDSSVTLSKCCGNTLCEKCLKNIKKTTNKCCPFCRKDL